MGHAPTWFCNLEKMEARRVELLAMDVASDRVLVTEWVALLACRTAAAAKTPEALIAAVEIATAAAAATADAVAATTAPPPAFSPTSTDLPSPPSDTTREAPQRNPSTYHETAKTAVTTTTEAMNALARALAPALAVANAAQSHEQQRSQRAAAAKVLVAQRRQYKQQQQQRQHQEQRQQQNHHHHDDVPEQTTPAIVGDIGDESEWEIVDAGAIPVCISSSGSSSIDNDAAADAELEGIVLASANRKLKEGIITKEEHSYIVGVHRRSRDLSECSDTIPTRQHCVNAADVGGV